MLRNLKKYIWSYLCKRMGLSWKLSSGLSIEIRNLGDWYIYNEIFVHGEYATVVDKVVKLSKSEYVIVDLGANVGYFGAYTCDSIFKSQSCARVRYYAVEPDKRCLRRLKDRFKDIQNLNLSFSPCLVGERVGFGKFTEGRESFASSLQKTDTAYTYKREFVDLDLFIDSEFIDLLKCDIEGAESLFLKNYQELIRRCKFLAVEWHYDEADIVDLEQSILSLGFVRLGGGEGPINKLVTAFYAQEMLMKAKL